MRHKLYLVLYMVLKVVIWDSAEFISWMLIKIIESCPSSYILLCEQLEEKLFR